MADSIEDDDFGFFPTGKSRLSSLFPSQNINEEEVNQSLTFVPPKQPRKTDDTSATSLKGLQLIHAVAGFTYKLEDGNYTNQGKLGTAILGDHAAQTYVLLLYKGKQQHVTHCTINYNFPFTIEPKNYAKFPDSKGEQWSVKFASEEMLIQFAKEIAIAKANSSGTPPVSLVIQDLVAGEGNPVTNGDSVDITYTGWLFRDHAIKEVFDDNSNSDKSFVVCLGKSNVVKGMSDGLVGCQKGMRRFLVIPSNLGYGVEGHPNKIPPNQTLVFEIVVNRVKFSREKSRSPSHGRGDSEIRQDTPLRSPSINEDTIRSRGVSISEQLTQSPRKDNAKIISRMAKMGLPMLPMQGVATIAGQTSSESETEREMEIEQHIRKPISSLHNVATVHRAQSDSHIEEIRPNVKSVSSTRTSSPHVQTLPFPQYANAVVPSEAVPFYQQTLPMPYMATPTPSFMDGHMPLLVAETRTQNTEVRLMLGKISDKLESIMPKIDELRLQQNATSFSNQAPYIDSVTLAQNIDRIIQENNQLKQENDTKTTKIQELNEKICDILQRNQGFFEESNSILEQRSDSLQVTTSQLQNKILVLEQEKNKSSVDLNEAVSNLNKTQSQLSEIQRSNKDYQDKLEALKVDKEKLIEVIESLKTQQNSKEKHNSHLDESLSDLNTKNASLLQQLEEANSKLKAVYDEKDLLKSQMQTLSVELTELKNEQQSKKTLVLQWKDKYNTLHGNATILKQKYEEQIKVLSTELKETKSTSNQQPTTNSTDDFSAEMRKAMNSLYKQLQSEVTESQTYSGKELLQLSLDVIRKVTIRIISMGKSNVQPSSRKSSADRSSQRSSVGHSSPSVSPVTVRKETATENQSESSSSTNIPKDNMDQSSSNVRDGYNSELSNQSEEFKVSDNQETSEDHAQVQNELIDSETHESEDSRTQTENLDIVKNEDQNETEQEVEVPSQKLTVEKALETRKSPDHAIGETIGLLRCFPFWRPSMVTVVTFFFVMSLLLYMSDLEDDVEATATHTSTL